MLFLKKPITLYLTKVGVLIKNVFCSLFLFLENHNNNKNHKMSADYFNCSKTQSSFKYDELNFPNSGVCKILFDQVQRSLEILDFF